MPVGLSTIILVILTPVFLTGESIIYFVIYELFGAAIMGFVFAFIFALWFAGKFIYREVVKHHLLVASLLYSIRVNLIIWSAFVISCLTNYYTRFNIDYEIMPLELKLNEMSYFVILTSLFLLLMSTAVSTVSIGLFICYLTKRLNRTR